MTAAAYLKANTTDLHKATEQALHANDIRRGTLTLANYQKVLLRHAAVWAGVSTRLDSAATADRIFVSEMLAALDKDLEFHSLPKPAPALISRNHLGDAAQDVLKVEEAGWGSLYVLRGSTLGGTMINRLLRSCPELSELPNYHFYEACENQPRRHWPDFLTRLEQALSTETKYEQAAVEASNVFKAYLY